jgi:hypothetical protein
VPLEATPVYRNLRTRVTFFGLEAEDLFVLLGTAVLLNIFGRFLNREMFGLPMNMVLQYIVPIMMVPALMLFKYGKQRAYFRDWVMFHAKPHVYSALERDSQFTQEYIRTEGA